MEDSSSNETSTEEEEEEGSSGNEDSNSEEQSTDEEEQSSDEEELLCPAAQLLIQRAAEANKVKQMNGQQKINKKRSSGQVRKDNDVMNNNNRGPLYHQEEQQIRQKRRRQSKENKIMMIEEREEEEEEEEDRRVTSVMKVREDTLDGAEEPDTDPPQRRKTIEDISITELTALRANLPPEYPDDESPPTLLPCLTCNRTFNPTALDRHRKVCQKLSESSKKKQVFNAHTQRFEGLDSSASIGASPSRAMTPERKSSGANKKPSRWREKHKEFLRTIRAARGTPEGDAGEGTPSVPSDYVRCPYCERHFGPKAADRHIEWCKEQSSRLRRTSADVQLTERLKSRTKYVPPKPGQSGWRAPKKTDVISSIPPPSTGADRKISPPSLAPPGRRGVSPAPQRAASLGRAAARSFSSLLQAVSNSYHSPYGQRGSASGYATPSSYSAYGGHVPGSQTPNLTRSGSFSGTSPIGSFSRSASLRVPNNRRSSGGGRIARRRDLASDMLASVRLSSSPARGEPEGNEDLDFSSRETTLSPPPYKPLGGDKYESPFDSKFDSSTYESDKYNLSKFDESDKFEDDHKLDEKFDDIIMELNYDPYSAAEMQMQALLGPNAAAKKASPPPSSNLGLGAAGLGTGGLSSPSYDRGGKSLLAPSSPPGPKYGLSKLNTSLSPSLYRRGHSPGLSEILASSPSPEKRSAPWRLSPSPPPRDRWSPHSSPTHAWSPTRSSPAREVLSPVSSPSLALRGLSSGGRCREDRFSFSSALNSSASTNTRRTSPGVRDDRFSFSSGSSSLRGNSPMSRDTNRLSSSGSSERPDRLSSSFSSSREADRLSPSSGLTVIERTQGNGASDASESNRKSSLTGRSPTLSGASTTTSSSLSALKSALQVNNFTNGRKNYSSLTDTKSGRTSSGSSSDSSLPPLSSSPLSSLSPSTNKPSSFSSSSRLPAPTDLSSTPRLSFTPRLSQSPRLDAKKTFFSPSPGEHFSSPSPGGNTLERAITSLSTIGGGSSASTDTSGGHIKFCHECGQKYPTNLAKFCCHCGAKRSA